MYFCTLPTSGCISHLYLRLDNSSSQKQGYDCRQLYVYGCISKAPIQAYKARSLAHNRGVCVLQPPSLPPPSQVPAVQASWHNSPLRVAPNHSGSLYGVLIAPAIDCKQRKMNYPCSQARRYQEAQSGQAKGSLLSSSLCHSPVKTSRTHPPPPFLRESHIHSLSHPSSRSQDLHHGIRHRCSHSPKPDVSIASL